MTLLPSIAANLATDLLKAGGGRLRDLALGTAEQRALLLAWEAAFAHMLTAVTPRAADGSPDAALAHLLGDIFQEFIAADGVADALLDVALVGQMPSLDALERRFDALDFDRDTLPVAFPQAIAALTAGLGLALLDSAMSADSPLHNRVNTARLVDVQQSVIRQETTLAQVADELVALRSQMRQPDSGKYVINIQSASGFAIGDGAAVQLDSALRPLLEQVLAQMNRQSAPDANRRPLPNPFGRTGRLTAPHYLPRPTLHNQLFDELRKGSSLSLVGESQTGKSSLLWHICQDGPAALARPSADFVYLSLELLRNDDDFFACVCEELGVPSLRGFRLARALRGRQVVLCLDEIEKMAWDGFTLELRTELRGLADGGDAPLTLVIASRSPLARLFPDSPQLTSPLAGLCTQVTMPPFTLAESQTLAAQYLAGSGLSLPPTAVAHAWQQSGGHPARLQQALHAAFTEYLA